MADGRRVAAGLFVALAALPADAARASPRSAELPPVLLWAWEQPQDLSFVDPRREGVAFLATTLSVDGETIRGVGRRQPLRLAPGTPLVAVARIEAVGSGTARTSPGARREIAERIASLSAISGVRAVQVDFDASVSQRDFYRDLVREVRAALPDSIGLSMTALASWCFGDPWLRALPVDEVVPMLFRMGADERKIRALLSSAGDFSCEACGKAVGLSTDEAPWRPPSARRLYLFCPGRWSEAAFRPFRTPPRPEWTGER